ncbi:MAG: hypothetical protein LBC03_06835 [Nitrososphaerota archaeon]|jgi:DNA modification methylase|nr:hypothetical protein [Nitrososphaerota archaeon]
MSEVVDNSVHLMFTSPSYHYDSNVGQSVLSNRQKDHTSLEKISSMSSVIGQIYDLMHENSAKTWQETYRALVEEGM